ncbi:MAG: aminoacyl-tRNA deacylase [Myxococcota bacterium]
MGISNRLKWFLESRGIRYEVVPHEHTSTSRETARVAHVPAEHLAKSVILEDERGYVMAIVPATCRVSLDALEAEIDRRMELASEDELRELFRDCELGAVPAIADPYGIPAVVDHRLWDLSDVYFEAGDHEDLVHLSGAEFQRLQQHALTASFGRRAS